MNGWCALIRISSCPNPSDGRPQFYHQFLLQSKEKLTNKSNASIDQRSVAPSSNFWERCWVTGASPRNRPIALNSCSFSLLVGLRQDYGRSSDTSLWLRSKRCSSFYESTGTNVTTGDGNTIGSDVRWNVFGSLIWTERQKLHSLHRFRAISHHPSVSFSFTLVTW